MFPFRSKFFPLKAPVFEQFQIHVLERQLSVYEKLSPFTKGCKIFQVYPCVDKIGYQVNIFLKSPRKHMLWALICFHGEISKISILLD